MPRLQWKRKVVTALVITVGCTILLLFKASGYVRYTEHKSANMMKDRTHKVTTYLPAQPKGHKLAIIVPFRDRFEELLEFVPYMHQFLTNASIDHKIYVINQADKLRFNRAALINIGYKMSVIECDYLAMHDVDLLPANPLLDYGYPKDGVFHVASPYLHPIYHYKTFVGGILILTHQVFQSLNGLSNRYWGWGREDDEFYVRMREAGLTIHRPDPQVVKTGYKTFIHIHDRVKHPRDNRRYGDQKKSGSHRDRRTGLANIGFELTETYTVTIEKAPATIYNVQLLCDKTDTPWCENPSQA